MPSIEKIIYNEITLPLKGKNLIITGNNGSGKTCFLTEVSNNLRGLKSSFYNDLLRKKLISEIQFGAKNFHSILNFNDIENEFIEELLADARTLSFNELYEFLKFFSNILKNRYQIFKGSNSDLQEKGQIEKIAKINEKLSNNYFYIKEPQHIDNYFNNTNKLINSYINKENNLEIIGNDLNKDMIYYFDAARVSVKDFSFDQFKTYDEYAQEHSITDIEGALEAYLLLNKLALLSLSRSIKINSINNQKIYKLERWFKKVESDLKWIFENNSTKLIFTRTGNKVLIQQDSNFFNFDELSSGFKAIFNIYANLLMRAQIKDLAPESLIGIAIIDEIDVHLHISLQKKVLPFLIKAFPKVQFIVSTHSPFVITSTDNETVVYDISSGDLFEEDLSFYSHDSIIKELFHVNPESNETINISKFIIEFVEKDMHRDNLLEIKNVLDRIEVDLPKLSIESQLQYIVAKNKLAKLSQEGLN
ncbi:hypothetical protein F991_00916 [Acinetobacter sp. CIP-A165]|uniref:AAA family ATPase n=1 Tax=Acinetobacter sp. CIP-A165 TaxID=40373 RepID=UPI0002CF3819|nr:AAA family ATPase [Acinetobacter sp. CIP-A165]ENU31203.1 hypothetical protein F991_00916 [Acinetobacter sp. CIP-A165]